MNYAGKTEFPVNTHVRVTHIASNDPDDKTLVGVTGLITHPFPGHMVGSPDKYIAGIWVDDDFQAVHGKEINLVRGDFVVATPELQVDNELDLPFENHFVERSEINPVAAAIIFTTEPQDYDNPNDPCDRSQVDVLACVDAAKDDADANGEHASRTAEFVTAALNAYVQTPIGKSHWMQMRAEIIIIRHTLLKNLGISPK